jgi:tetratricopeptide (TPR) repeat protein
VRQWSPILKILLWEKPLFFPFGLILPLALAGMVLAKKNTIADRATNRLLLIYIVIYAAGVIAFFVTSRHRLPLVPVLIPYAALTLTSLSRGLADIKAQKISEPWTAAIAAAVFCFAFFLSNTEYFDVQKVPQREEHMNMGFAYSNEEALTEFRTALAEDPKLDRAVFNIGAIYLLMERLDEAERAFWDTLKINPNFADAWIHLGNVYFKRGKLDDAENAYRKAISITPNHPLAHYNLALLLKQKGDMEGYVSELLLANRSDPSFAPANVGIAKLLIEQGRHDEARIFIQKAMVVNPADPNLKTLMKMVSQGHR